jgi:hypothetical protein
LLYSLAILKTFGMNLGTGGDGEQLQGNDQLRPRIMALSFNWKERRGGGGGESNHLDDRERGQISPCQLKLALATLEILHENLYALHRSWL